MHAPKNTLSLAALTAAAVLTTATATAQNSPFSRSQSGVVTIQGTAGNDDVRVAYGSSPLYVTVSRGTAQATYFAWTVREVRCFAGDGDDRLHNATSIPCRFDGGRGDDHLQGGSGADRLVGNYGNDRIHGGAGDDVLWGSGGADVLYGEDGDDDLRGHGGNDVLRGGNGRDELFPGTGNDWVYGESGQDLIVTVGAGRDVVFGGHQWDNFWVDASDIVVDPSPNEQRLGYVHTIQHFEPLTNPFGTWSVSLEPAGQSFADPLPQTRHTATAMRPTNQGLFGPAGPRAADVIQGAQADDCYFMALLSATAEEQPEEIRKLVTSLGDGTYAVRFFRNGVEEYIRVDGDFWTDGNGGFLYARPGPTGAMWGPVVEKAYAFFRRRQGTYDSIRFGEGGLHFGHLGAAQVNTQLDPNFPGQANIIFWDQTGRANAWMTFILSMQARELMNWIDGMLDAGHPVITGTRGSYHNGMPFTPTNWRRGQHQYHILEIQRDGQGTPTAMVLRDPYDDFVTITDPARIVFFIGRAQAAVF